MPSSFNKKPLVYLLNSKSCPQFKQKTSKNIILGSLISCSLLFSACSVLSPPPMPRGTIIEKNDLSALKVGSTSKSDVIDILGSPTTYATFNNNNWIYISMMTHLVPLSYPGIKKQKVLSLYFNESGTLTKIQELGKRDAKNVSMVSEVTPTPGTKTNFFQQLLGNIGKYSPLSAMGLGSTFGPNSNGGPFSSNPLTTGGPGSSGNTLP
ncbi:outer membrane protein assembly factor BamE [Commensalibacter sp. M0134]|uniref:outer membrane protein assembly factor BamE n=1 Tax=Commensalibacter TaxID=1079922 RepID=UPI0012D9D74E|nr:MULTISPECIES: outer membrane protein assembly factor BamE [Commensalibacter]MBI0065365.1 outer membrane protein assembly factor BamE [Commensalibacter sp. M0134]MBI0069248.1 outer membrane protein assembly factor BamE [Commensalibacter sp. M0133]MBI0081149.1 outer membrane protein assembly factor BamE [Commensalibacter melissae]MBI0082861.1 outer membrane protein assembly factor BamE [Commensalibacter sp. W6292M3]MBI0088322.1 outer membrane protein assembly factor BamE [Commensalibacter mel